MAESYSVKAVLCAEDKNFSSMMKSCSSYAENLKNTLTSGIGFGAMAAIGSKAVSAVVWAQPTDWWCWTPHRMAPSVSLCNNWHCATTCFSQVCL